MHLKHTHMSCSEHIRIFSIPNLGADLSRYFLDEGERDGEM